MLYLFVGFICCLSASYQACKAAYNTGQAGYAKSFTLKIGEVEVGAGGAKISAVTCSYTSVALGLSCIACLTHVLLKWGGHAALMELLLAVSTWPWSDAGLGA